MSETAQAGAAPLDLDVDIVEVAKLYVDAVWKVAVQQGTQKDFLDEYDSFLTEIVEPSPELRAYFNIVAVDVGQRAAMIEKMFRGKTSDLLVNFLLVLNKHGRLSAIRAARKVLHDLWDASQNVVLVTAKTAAPMPEDQLESLRKTVADSFKIVPDLRNEVEPALLGGLWLRVGEKVYDRTLRSDLARLKDNILSRRPNEI